MDRKYRSNLMHARIYKPTKNAMQSGKANTKRWRLEFVPEDTRFVEPIMGWTGAKDMYANEVVLYFDTKKEAEAYAKREGIDYKAYEPKEAETKVKSYSDNFKYTPPEE